MKKQYISALLIASMLLGGSALTFAADSKEDAVETTPSAISVKEDASKVATNIPKKLSLDEAIKIMQTTGASAETAELNRKSDDAIARGYAETVTSIKEAFDGLDKLQYLINIGYPGVSSSDYMSASSSAEAAGATVTNQKIMKLRRDFAKAQGENNYKAELNSIEYTTVQLYSGVLLAQDNLRIAKDNLKVQQDILKNTQTQYKVGMVAQKDVLSAQSSLEAAKSDVQSAETKLETARMSFNFLLGYPVMQEITFTDTLKELPAPKDSLEASIDHAIKNRNEIKGANFAKEVHGILLESLKYRYPQNSSTYLKQQVAYLNAEKTAKDAPNKIEIDIRSQKSSLDDLKTALESARARETYAKEGYRLTNLSFEAGMCTLAELQQTQVLSYKASLGVAAAINDYNLAIYQFKYATDVGTTRLPL
ncbi:TolC family protein [Anaerovorax sp. IOR16]|uniref:TolC family protein n=1 Tax=Anaerovorax sp. IOR16 TaxID=2773458 RepID=UPI0019D116DE|nr:TolC family protein [Anaerovorax sp. IOR16]